MSDTTQRNEQHPVTQMSDRIEAATEAAQLAFWAAVAAQFPEITTGDMDPIETFRFDQACANAVTGWVDGNTPLGPRYTVKGPHGSPVRWSVVDTDNDVTVDAWANEREAVNMARTLNDPDSPMNQE